MSHPTSRPMFHEARQRVHPSLLFTAATVVLFTIAASVPLTAAHARDATGNYYYDRYALPWVQAYAPPNTAPGTFDERANGTNIPRGTGDQY